MTKEVPITVHYDEPIMHKKHPVMHDFDIIGQSIGTERYKRPLLMFRLPGGVLDYIGLIVGSWAFTEDYVCHDPIPVHPDDDEYYAAFPGVASNKDGVDIELAGTDCKDGESVN